MCSRLARFVRKTRGRECEAGASVDLFWLDGLRTKLLPLVRSHRILELLPLGGRPLALLRLPFALLRLSLVLQSLQKVESSTT